MRLKFLSVFARFAVKLNRAFLPIPSRGYHVGAKTEAKSGEAKRDGHQPRPTIHRHRHRVADIAQSLAQNVEGK